MAQALIPDRWFRHRPDSRLLGQTRTLERVLVPLGELDVHIRHYEQMQSLAADLRMPIPDFGGLELCAVGGILLIASERPFTIMQRLTQLSFIVADLDVQLDLAQGIGAEVLEPEETILPGRRARILYAGDIIAELVEHRPLPSEAPYPVGNNRSAFSTPIEPRVAVDALHLPAAVDQLTQVVRPHSASSCPAPPVTSSPQHVRLPGLLLTAT